MIWVFIEQTEQWGFWWIKPWTWSPGDQVLAPAQSFPIIAEYFDCELLAFRSRDRDRAFAIVPFDGDFKTYRSFDRSIRDRISFNEIPV
jgi:hypothetical protein